MYRKKSISNYNNVRESRKKFPPVHSFKIYHVTIQLTMYLYTFIFIYVYFYIHVILFDNQLKLGMSVYIYLNFILLFHLCVYTNSH